MTDTRPAITAYVPTGAVAAAGLVFIIIAALVAWLANADALGVVLAGAGVFTLGEAAGLSAARRDAKAAGGAYLVAHRNGRWEVIPGTEPTPINAHATARAIAAHLEHATNARPVGQQAAVNATRRAHDGPARRRPPGHGLTFPSDEEPRP